MLKTITATICLHPIRSSAELPHSARGINFNIPYCSACTESRKIANEHETIEREHQQLKTLQRPEFNRPRLRVSFDEAPLVYQDHLREQKRCHGSFPKPYLALQDLPERRYSRPFDVMQEGEHRPEGQYRKPVQFDRADDEGLYSPGLYADRSGNGLIDSSGACITDEEFEYDSDEERDKDGDFVMGDMGEEEEGDDEEEEEEEEWNEGVDSVMGGVEDEEDNHKMAHLPHPEDWDDGDAGADWEARVEEEGGGEESVTAEDDGAEDDGDGDDSDLEKLTSEELMERIFVIEERLTELRC
jgi:hypothetical protein